MRQPTSPAGLNNSRNSEDGFTLLEVVCVIAILAILASIAVPILPRGTSRTKLESYETLCKDIGEQPADVALAWVLHQKAVTSPIIGPRTLKQLDGSMHALQITLSPDTMKRLDTIFPGPGGPAPEAYAW